MSRTNLGIFTFFWLLGSLVIILGYRTLDLQGYFIFFIGAPMFFIVAIDMFNYGVRLIRENS